MQGGIDWSKMCYVKVHRYGGEVLVALCDEELLGRTLSDGRIEFEVSERFYGGIRVTLREAARYIAEGTIINAVGENVISMLVHLNEGVLEAVVWIAGVPHVQIVR